MRNRSGLGVVFTAALIALLATPAWPQSAPSAEATPLTVTNIVSGLTAAGRSAAGDVYIVHQYGANLGLAPADVAQFDGKYTRLSTDANGLLNTLASSVASNHVEQGKVQAAYASVLSEAKDLDATVAAVQAKNQANSNATQYGLPLLGLLKSVAPLLNSIGGAISGAITAGETAFLAAQIRLGHWPDVKAATAGAQPTSPPASGRSQ
jgi:hypothetical protein